MKRLIFIFAVCFITVLEGRVCLSSANGTPVANMTCAAGVDFCMKLDCKISGNPLQLQGCGDTISNATAGLPDKCTAAGVTTLSASGLTGQYFCCNDKDLCNDKSLDPNATNSASKPLVFGLIMLSIVLALLY